MPYERRYLLSTFINFFLSPISVNARALSITKSNLKLLSFIPLDKREGIRRGVSDFDCTAAIEEAIEQANRTNCTLYVEAGTYCVSTVRISGSFYEIAIDEGAHFKQRNDLPGQSPHPVFEIIRCHSIKIGRLSVEGNIYSDSGEHHHGVILSESKNIQIDSIAASNIRGDGLYCYGRSTSENENLNQIRIGTVSGRNIFRNLVSITGGEIVIRELLNAGQIGYRDLDIEPNAEGKYQPAEVTIHKAVVGSVEVTSDDPQLTGRFLKIFELDADGERIKPTSPPYPRAPGLNGYALGLAHVDRVEIVHAKLRNYASYAINIGARARDVVFRSLDIRNCDFSEKVFNACIVKRGDPRGDQLKIDRLVCVHSDNSKWVIHSDLPGMYGIIGGGTVSHGLLAVNCTMDVHNLTLNAGGASGPGACIIVGGRGSRLESVSIHGAQQATLLFDSPECLLVSCEGQVAHVSGGQSRNTVIIRSDLTSTLGR